jgi:hypothetical protein
MMEDLAGKLADGSLSEDLRWKIWRVDFCKKIQLLFKALEKVKKKIIRASIRNSKQHRLFYLMRNEVAAWYKIVAPKERELPTPVMFDEMGKAITSREERLKATAKYHQEWAKKRGKPFPGLRVCNDPCGRPRVEWIEKEEEYRRAVEERLREVREVEAVRSAEKICERWEASELERIEDSVSKCKETHNEQDAINLQCVEMLLLSTEKEKKLQEVISSEGERLSSAYKDAWQFARNNWFPGAFKMDWGVSEEWPCFELTEEEWNNTLNKPTSKMRNSGFVLSVIRCLPLVFQEAWKQVLNLSIRTGMSASEMKIYIRIAIPKNLAKTQFRHLAIGYDLHCIQSQIYHNRLMALCRQHPTGFFPEQIVGFMPNRGCPDANLVKKGVREDAEQARKEDDSVSLACLSLDAQKFYDSLPGDFLDYTLQVLGAPLMLRKVVAETSYDNRCFVRTTEGDTEVIDHQDGQRQGLVMACSNCNFASILMAETLKGRDLMYQMRFVEDPIDPDELGVIYVDDSDNHLRGTDALKEATKILGFLSIVARVGMNGNPKSFFTLSANSQEMIDHIHMIAWNREEESIVENRIDRLKGEDFWKPLV